MKFLRILMIMTALAALVSPLLRADVYETNNTPCTTKIVMVKQYTFQNGWLVNCPTWEAPVAYGATLSITDYTYGYYVPDQWGYPQYQSYEVHFESQYSYHVSAPCGPMLSRATSQAYAGTDIFPNICTNAQNEYKQAMWKVSLPNGGTATLSATGGVALSKTSNIVNNDVITVTAGNQTGTYQLTLTPSNDSQVTAQGVVFAFKFEGFIDHSNYTPQGTTNGGQFDGYACSVKVADDVSSPGMISTHLSSAGREANTSRNTKVYVTTVPLYAFLGNVAGTFKVDTWYQPFATLRKDDEDEGPTVAFSISPLPWLQLSTTGGGYLHSAAVKAAGQITMQGGSTTTYGGVAWSTKDFQCPAWAAYWTESFGGANITRTEVDSSRIYEPHTTKVDVRTEVGMVGYCSSNYDRGTQVRKANASGQSAITLSAHTSFTIQ